MIKMTRIVLNGVLGKMGRVLAEMIAAREDLTVAYGIDKNCAVSPFEFPVYTSPDEVPENAEADVIIDFSHFTAVPGIVKFAVSRKLPIVVCTTGLGDDEKELLKEASKTIPLFTSANMSIGVTLLKKLCREASQFLGEDFDIEIVERHHNQKVDAPSGTALAIADAINDENDGKFDYIYDRHSVRQKRSKREIGISAVRGGSIVGDHEVIFAGPNEVIEINHHAQSRNVFADGALKAAVFVATKAPGYYNMESMI